MVKEKKYEVNAEKRRGIERRVQEANGTRLIKDS